MGHNPQLLGKPFNDVLREFLLSAESATAADSRLSGRP
jgi:hypothetical protein